MKRPPKVFISYAHDSESFADEILGFSDKLRENYIDANIDQYEESPTQGWPRWMEEEITNSDFVLIICTEKFYQNIMDYKSGKGKGVNWEISLIYQNLYDSCSRNNKFIPIIFRKYATSNILTPLRSSTIYYIDKEKDFTKLCNRLKGIKNVVKPKLGYKEDNTVGLDVKQRKNLFVTSMIDLEKWNKAGWSGASY